MLKLLEVGIKARISESEPVMLPVSGDELLGEGEGWVGRIIKMQA